MNLLQKKQHIEFLASQQEKIQEQRKEQTRNEEALVQRILDEWKAKNK